MNKEKKDPEKETVDLKAKLESANKEILRLASAEEKSGYPHLRISPDGVLLYANSASFQLLSEWNISINQKVHDEILRMYPPLSDINMPSGFIKLHFRNFAVGFTTVPVPSLGYINLYGNEFDYTLTTRPEENGKHYKRLIENSQAVLVRCKVEKNLPVVFVSENISQFGFNINDFLNKKLSYLDIIHPDDKDRIMKEVSECSRLKEKNYMQEYRIVTRNGEVRWIEDRTIVPESDDTFHESVIIDVTEKKKHEQLLKQSLNDLKAANEELDRFVYSASHDLKAPLRSIVGLVNIAKTESSRSGIDVYLDKILHSANKLDNFISDLINFSKNTRLESSSENIDLIGLANEAAENLRYMDNADKIKLDVKANNVLFRSDKKRLYIMFSNLISNSIKYQNLSSDEPQTLEIHMDIDTKNATLTFSDNGIGIAKENLPKIYNMFYRASTQAEGSGLGMYIVKEIVNKLNGKIRISSNVNVGTKFIVTIPNEIEIK